MAGSIPPEGKMCHAVISKDISRGAVQTNHPICPSPAGGRFFLSVVIYVVRAKTRKINAAKK